MHILQLDTQGQLHRLYETLQEGDRLDTDALLLGNVADAALLAAEGWALLYTEPPEPVTSTLPSVIGVRRELAPLTLQIPAASTHITAVHMAAADGRLLLVHACHPAAMGATQGNDELSQALRQILDQSPAYDECIVAAHGTGKGTPSSLTTAAIATLLAQRHIQRRTPTPPASLLVSSTQAVYASRPDTRTRTLALHWETGSAPLSIDVPRVHRPGPSDNMSLGRVDWTCFPSKLRNALRRRSEQSDSTTEWAYLYASLHDALQQSRKAPKKGTHPCMAGWDDTCRDAVQRQSALLRALVCGTAWSDKDQKQAALQAAYRRPEYKRATKVLLARIKAAKRNLVHAKMGSLTERSHWRMVHLLRGERGHAHELSPPLRAHDGTMVPSLSGKMAMLAQHLFPAAPRCMPHDPHGRPEPMRHRMAACTTEEIDSELALMESDAAPGPDGVSPRLLRAAYDECTPFRHRFRRLLQRSIELGDIPMQWKQAKVTVIPKPGKRDRSSLASYRPITVLNVGIRILDGILTQRVHALAPHGLLTRHHYGGIKGKSTAHALCALLEHAHRAQQQGHTCLLATIDVSGAFNNIEHERLVSNVRAAGHDALAEWLQRWLAHRTFHLHFERSDSTTYRLAHRGIPQGSPLSPVLWSLYLDPFFRQQAHSDAILEQGAYVDDLFVLCAAPTPRRALQATQQWMDELGAWASERRLRLDKPALLQTPAAPDEAPLLLRLPDGTHVASTKELRLLGILLSADVTLAKHITQCTQKVITLATELQDRFGSDTGTTWVQRQRLAQAFLASLLDYGCPLFHHLGPDERQAVARADQAISRFILDLPIHAPDGPKGQALLHELGLLSTMQRWAIQQHTFAAKLMSGEGHLRQLAIDDPAPLTTADSRLLGPLASLCRRCPRAIEPLCEPLMPPWKWNSLRVHMGENKEQAEKSIAFEQNCARRLNIFTDGSDQLLLTTAARGASTDRRHHHVGAAAVAYRKGQRQWIIAAQLDSATNDIFRAELAAILLALRRSRTDACQRINILSDSRAAITRLQVGWRSDQSSGQSMTAAIRREGEERRKEGKEVHFWWVPSHVGIEGNEVADTMAKRVARDSPLPSPCETPRGKMEVENEDAPTEMRTVPIGILRTQERARQTTASTPLAHGHQTVAKGFAPSNYRTYLDMPKDSVAALALARTDTMLATPAACPCDDKTPCTRTHLLFWRSLLQQQRASLLRELPIGAHHPQGLLRGGQTRDLAEPQRRRYLDALARWCTDAVAISRSTQAEAASHCHRPDPEQGGSSDYDKRPSAKTLATLLTRQDESSRRDGAQGSTTSEASTLAAAVDPQEELSWPQTMYYGFPWACDATSTPSPQLEDALWPADRWMAYPYESIWPDDHDDPDGRFAYDEDDGPAGPHPRC